MTEMALAKDNHVVNTFPPDRPDQPLRLAILPRRRWCRPAIADAHGTNTSDEDRAIGSIAVTDEIAGSLAPSAGLGELPGKPFRGWMRGGRQPQEPASVMPQDQNTIEKPERNRRHHEQIHRGDAVGMVAEKGPPAL